MIYGQDEAIAFPVADLYDSGIMKMYISAVRDQYKQGLKDYENFMSKYGDFISPFRKDVDMWNNEVMGPTMNLIDRMYAAGIDPTRNQEARAMIQQSMRNIPYSKVATARQNAKVGEEYIKARGALAAKGLYDKDYTDFWLAEQGYKPFEEWSAEDGAWNISSPIEYKDLFTATDPWFKNMKPHELTKKQVLDANYEYDPRYKYTGIPEEDLYQVTGERIPGFMNSIEGRYYRDRVKRELEAAGVEPTEKAVNDELARRIVIANHAKVVDPTSDADDYAKMDYAKTIDDQKAARDYKYDIAKMKFSFENDPSKTRYLDEDGNYVGGGSSSRSSGGGNGSGRSNKFGHSHVYDQLMGSLSGMTGLRADELQENPALTSMAILGSQQELLSNNKNPKDFMYAGSAWDAPGTIVNMFPGRKATANNTIPMTYDDMKRMWSSDVITSRAYGSSWFKSATTPKQSLYHEKKSDKNYSYGMQPTGRTRTVYCKDGSTRMYVEMNAYRRDGSNANSTLENMGQYWYDMHITTESKKIPKRQFGIDENGKGFIKIGNKKVMEGIDMLNGKPVNEDTIPPIGYFPEEWLNLSIDDKFGAEQESRDINIGHKSFSDSSTGSDKDARL